MGSLSRKMGRAANGGGYDPFKKRKDLPKTKTVESDYTNEGIFCDCYGTLYDYSYEKHELLVSYLNAKHAAGKTVRLISTNPNQVREKISDIGLHPDIVNSLTWKDDYHGCVLEEWIDDDPILLKAVKIWNPKDPAFKKHMQDFIAKNSAPEIPLTSSP